MSKWLQGHLTILTQWQNARATQNEKQSESDAIVCRAAKIRETPGKQFRLQLTPEGRQRRQRCVCKKGRINSYYVTIPQWTVFVNSALICNIQLSSRIFKFSLFFNYTCLLCYFATCLVNKDVYIKRKIISVRTLYRWVRWVVLWGVVYLLHRSNLTPGWLLNELGQQKWFVCLTKILNSLHNKQLCIYNCVAPFNYRYFIIW